MSRARARAARAVAERGAVEQAREAVEQKDEAEQAAREPQQRRAARVLEPARGLGREARRLEQREPAAKVEELRHEHLEREHVALCIKLLEQSPDGFQVL